jgi:hypothetical protein
LNDAIIVFNKKRTKLAKMLKPNQSRVAKMEAGDPSVSLDLLIKSLLALGTTKRDLAGRLVSLSNNDFEDGTLKPVQDEPRHGRSSLRDKLGRCW